VSHLFQRPLCEMGGAYDYAYRPTVGDPSPEDGGGCDDRPKQVELYRADADPSRTDPAWRTFSVCPEHESQLRRYDERLRERGIAPRFRSRPNGLTSPPGRGR
jgi:hypothetical protein